jgi:hypothetical protein
MLGTIQEIPRLEHWESWVLIFQPLRGRPAPETKSHLFRTAHLTERLANLLAFKSHWEEQETRVALEDEPIASPQVLDSLPFEKGKGTQRMPLSSQSQKLVRLILPGANIRDQRKVK